MIGNERINPDAKFMELFKRVGQLEIALRAAEDRLTEHHSAINFVPAGLSEPPRFGDDRKKTLHLKSGTR